ncbi:Ig-like domain-containing protein [Bacillus sp. sid0103]|uniref:Ig-like domain-containing protein n=1 Tax=Bacillus sp. sid0103 TaxID=2856337 RepID=UPI001C44092E|nr:Ig-like domain-containing protein [Bacillus sp. sid0103]MBV7505284.1 Ig-like domain-containing protein [Bacillus sp. sid0103]
MTTKVKKRITALTLIFTVILSLFSSLASASSEKAEKVTKEPPSKEIVKLTPSESKVSFSLSKGKHVLKAEAEYKDGSKADVTAEGKWTSLDEKVVTVASGMLTAVHAGSTHVQFSLRNTVLNVEVNVTTQDARVLSQLSNPSESKKIVSLVLEAEQITYIDEGQERPIALKALYNDGSMEDVTKLAKWESGDPSIAKVEKGVIKGISPGNVPMKVTYANFPQINFFASIGDIPENITGLYLSADSFRLETSDKPVQVGAFIKNPMLGNKAVTSSGSWTTSDRNVATVSNNGQITPVGIGQAYIYFKYDKLVGAVLVNVVKPTKLVTDEPTVELLPGQNWPVNLTEVFTNGISEGNLNLRENVYPYDVKWTVDDNSIATVTDSGNIIGGKTGKTIVTASYRSDVLPPVKIEVTVTNKLTTPRVIGLTASPSNLSLGVGDESPVAITAIYSDGSTEDVSGSVEFYSENSKVASTQRKYGGAPKVIGQLSGTTVLHAIYDNFRYFVDIPVAVTDKDGQKQAPNPESISVTPDMKNMVVNQQQQLEVKTTYSDRSNSTSYAVYKSSNPDVVKVNKDGLLTAVGTGTTIITVDSSGYSKQVSIVVSNEPSIDFANKIVDLIPSENDITFSLSEHTHSFSVKAKYKDGSTADVTSDTRFTSLDPDKVTVKNGVLTAVAAGTTQVLIDYGTSTKILNVSILSGNDASIKDLKIESLLVSSLDVVVQKDKLYPVHVFAQYNDGTQREITNSIQWTTDEPTVVSVKDGKFIGMNTGKTTVSATIAGFSSIKIPVKVQDQAGPVNLVGIVSAGMIIQPEAGNIVEAITNNSNGMILHPEEGTIDANAFAEYTDHNIVQVDTEGKWESSDESVATVDQNGVITWVGPGEAYIWFNYYGLRDAIWVRNTKPVDLYWAENNKWTTRNVMLEPNKSTDISINGFFGHHGRDGNCDCYNLTSKAKLTVADESVATISADGHIIAHSVGKTTITATVFGMSKTIDVEVVAKYPTFIRGISSSPGYIVNSAGSTNEVVINAMSSDGTIKDVTADVKWNSSNSEVAEVTADHKILTKSEGAAVIIAEYGGFKIIIPVIVKPN